jgi:hypothetical protein
LKTAARCGILDKASSAYVSRHALRQHNADELVQIHGALAAQVSSPHIWALNVPVWQASAATRTSFSTSVSFTTSMICSSVRTSPCCEGREWECRSAACVPLNLSQKCDQKLRVYFVPLRFRNKNLNMRVTCMWGWGGEVDEGWIDDEERTSNAAFSSCIMLDSCFFL